MERTPVESKNIASIGYNPEESRLEIEFTSGAVYQYLNVPKGAFQGIMKSPSKGHYFHKNIKQYTFVKIEKRVK